MKKFWIAIVFVLLGAMGNCEVVNASETTVTSDVAAEEISEFLEESMEFEEPEENEDVVVEDITRMASETSKVTVGDVTYTVYTRGDGTLALYSCSGQVENLVIPENINGVEVTCIGEWFWKRSTLENLTTVELPGTVTELEYGVFRECETLTSVKFSEGLKTIGKSAFYDCVSLQNVDLPDTVTYIGQYAFRGCSSFTTFKIPQGVTALSKYVLCLCTSLKEMVVPEQVTVLEEGVFDECGALEKVILPAEMTSVGAYAFYDCVSLQNVDLPDTVTYIGEYAFRGCSSLVEFKIPQGITELSDRVFYRCTSLKKVEIPAHVTALGEGAFCRCDSLESVDVPKGLDIINGWLFYGCKSLKEIEIPAGVKSIGNSSFYGCESITEFRIPAGVTTIDDWAFAYCYSLKSFEFPKGIKVLEDHVLSTSPALESVTIPEGVTSINYRAFFGCDALKTIKIPKGVENIGEEAFIYCHLLEDIVIPKTVKNIGTDAFKGTATGMRVHCIKYSYADNTSLYPDGVIFVYGEDVSPLREFVERMYTVALEREADKEGADFWEEKLLNRSRDGAGLAQGFILSPEFKGYNYGDSKYIQILYKTFFNRAGDQSGISYWADAISAGTSREAVLAGFVNSVEFDDLCTYYGISRGVLREDGNALNPGIVLFAKRLYTKVLGREGDKSGVEYWAMQLADGISTPEEAARNFFFGDEYLAKNTSDADYIRALYLTFMDREADVSGLEYWKGMLSSGVSRESALAGFAASPEFRTIMVEYGL